MVDATEGFSIAVSANAGVSLPIMASFTPPILLSDGSDAVRILFDDAALCTFFKKLCEKAALLAMVNVRAKTNFFMVMIFFDCKQKYKKMDERGKVFWTFGFLDGRTVRLSDFRMFRCSDKGLSDVQIFGQKTNSVRINPVEGFQKPLLH